MPRTSKPPTTPLSNLFRHIKPSWRDYMRYVRMAASEDDEDMLSIATHYDALTYREKKTITPEQLCAISDVKPSDLLAQVVAKMFEMSHAETQLITASLLPSVVERTGKIAAGKGKFSSKEREFFLKGGGFLPVPKGGTSISIANNPQTLNLNGRPQLGQLPGSEDDMLEMEDRETKLITSGGNNG